MVRSKRIRALTIDIAGAVQGVGFRPFVCRLSRKLGVQGFVRNSPTGVHIEAEAPVQNLSRYVNRLRNDHPESAWVQSFHSAPARVRGFSNFEILDSETDSARFVVALPDLAICGDCRKEIFDPQNRRYLYPFTNCTHCGPRYSILEGLPYDRARTSMKKFAMCPECTAEFEDPDNRRFHAQPNACPKCGPSLELWSNKGDILERKQEALNTAVKILKTGKILALKGLGGFQLLVDAGNEEAVKILRIRKHREQKPLALMFEDIHSINKFCKVSAAERKLLVSPQAPIVLLARLAQGNGTGLARNLALDNPYLGAMLAYSPLHQILVKHFGKPLVATSGNLTDEPICIDEKEAVVRLGKIADAFLVHDRPIVRPMDDSVARIICGKPVIQRRARGYAPWPVEIDERGPAVLGLGGHFKNTVSLKVGRNVFLSQHIGDLQNAESLSVFERSVRDLKNLYGPQSIEYVCDSHPDYFATRFAKNSGAKVLEVQHHHAHIAAVMAEYKIKDEVLGLAWDGTGLGTDKTVWGGEILRCTLKNFTRVAHVRNFRLPGGDGASRVSARSALGLVHEMSSGKWQEYFDLPCFKEFSCGEIAIIGQLLSRPSNSPLTSSMGRLFDAISSLTGVCQKSDFEGQAAMMFEFALKGEPSRGIYPYLWRKSGECYIFDWEPMIRQIISDVRGGKDASYISRKFHDTLVDFGLIAAEFFGIKKIVLGGGCFQNKYLLEKLSKRLSLAGFDVFFPRQVPVNDGGLSLGQAAVASAILAGESAAVNRLLAEKRR